MDDFDWEFYINLYNDLKFIKTKEEAYNHYITQGKYENRVIDKKLYNLFDHVFYINRYNDANQFNTKEESYKHYINYGIYENRFISEDLFKKYNYFNWEFYVIIYNLEVLNINTKEKAFLYYMKNNIDDVMFTNIETYHEYDNFDWVFYNNLYKDLKELNIDSKYKGFLHYIQFGKYENRICSMNIEFICIIDNNEYIVTYKNFDMIFYTNLYHDIKHINKKEIAFLHYINHGIYENRFCNEEMFNLINGFDWKYYITIYKICDKITTKEEAYKHWMLKKNHMSKRKLKFKSENSKSTFVTFIIPTIGRDSLISSIKSLLKLNDPNWKAIILFDGIKNNINNTIIDPINDPIIDKRITFIELEKKEGILDKFNKAGHVRNIGFKHVTDSEWIAFLDDDDYLSSDYIDKLKYEININSCIDVCIFRMIFENGIVLPSKIDKNINKNRVGISFAIKSKIANTIIFKNNNHEDYYYLKELEYKNYKIVISPFICYYVREIPFVAEKLNINSQFDRILIN